jgi:hypothetical protein
MPAGRGGGNAAAAAPAAADLDAELDDLLAASEQPGRAAAAAGGGGAELDFDDELDALFGAQGGSMGWGQVGGMVGVPPRQDLPPRPSKQALRFSHRRAADAAPMSWGFHGGRQGVRCVVGA